MRRLGSVLALASLLAACGGDAPQPPADGRPPVAQLLMRNLHLPPGPDRAIRIGFEGAGSTAFVRPSYDVQGARVHICPLAAIGDRLEPAACERNLPNGVRHAVPTSGATALAVMSEPGSAVTLELFMEFDEAGRSVELRLPEIPAPGNRAACGDNACNPFFELTPTHDGPFTATASWSGSDAVFALLQGSVRGRSQTATGIPYREPARADGASPLQITTQMTARDEYALVLRHADAGPAEALRDVVIRAEWPASTSS